MKLFFKKLEPCSGVDRKAVLLLDSCDPLVYGFDPDRIAIRLFNLNRQLVGICQQDSVLELLCLFDQGWEIDFSVEEVRLETYPGGLIDVDVLLRVAAFAPVKIAEITDVLADYVPPWLRKGKKIREP